MIKTKVKIKVLLTNKTENNTQTIYSNGIRNKNKITYVDNNVKYIIKYSNNTVNLIRETKEFLNILPLIANKKTTSQYTIKEKNITIDIIIFTNYIKITENKIEINYKVLDSNNEYIYRIEVKDINDIR